MKYSLRIFVLLFLAALALPGRAAVVINEIMYHPASELTTEEYIELYNTGAVAVDVSGWKITSGVRYTFPAGTMIGAGAFLVVTANPAVFHAKYPAVANYIASSGWQTVVAGLVQPNGGILSNSADHIVLVNAAGAAINDVSYADDGDWGVRRRDYFADWGHRGWTWDSPADGGTNSTPVFQNQALTDPYAKGKSLELVNANFSNASGQNWKAGSVVNGTPGAANSVAAGDIAPEILNVAHFPFVPTHNDTVTITAKVVNDEASVPVVTLHWRVCATVSPYTDPAFTTAVMFDDGAHGDALAGDGVYGVSIPAQANSAIIEFYLDAHDGGNHTRTWPAPALDETLTAVQTQNCLYQVDDTVYAAAQPIYRMVMKPADKVELVQINATTPAAPYPYGTGETAADQSYSHADFNTTWITTDGTGSELRYLAGVRNRGHGSRKKLPEGFNVVFPNADTWQKITSLNLNTQYPYSQLFGSALLRKAGLAGPESRPVQVRWNAANAINAGTPSFGFYVANEVQDSAFAGHHFPLDSSGNIYRSSRYDFTVPVNTMSEGDLTYKAPNVGTTGQTPADPYRTVWFKHTNSSEDDWTDLIALTQTLAKGHSAADFSTTYDADYQTAVEAKVDVEEWMRFFAVQTIVDNTETNISNGYGDDFYLYLGKTDTRAKFVPYDLDTICNQGDTAAGTPQTHGLFRMVNKDDAAANGPAVVLNAFFKFPAFAPIYYKHLHEQLTTAFATANFNALVDEMLGSASTGFDLTTQIASIKSFENARTAYLATLVPLNIAVTTGPAVASGYPHTTTATTNLVGVANSITTRTVKVNGVAATWSAWQATWTANGVALNPGVNRVLIQAFDANSVETERFGYDVWYDKGSTTAAGGTIAANTTWTAANGPYNVTSNLVIASPATLTIQPGTTVYLGSGINITVNNGGKLDAQGTDAQPIRFTVVPGSGVSWGGMVINGVGASPETRVAYAFIEGNGNTGIEVAGGTLYLDHTTFLTTTHQYVSLDASSFYISNCYFPTTTASFELLHGTGGIKAGGRGIVRECFFGTTTNYNDIMDFTGGNREDGLPIIQYYNNVFVGGSDDQLDLDGTDAWIEGNIFLHSHRNGATPDSSASISGGNYDFGASGPGGIGVRTSEITVIGNLFFDDDNAATAKEANFFNFINNTIVHTTKAGGIDYLSGVVNVRDIANNGTGAATAFGKGFYLEGNIILDAESLVRNYDAAQVTVTFNNNILPYAWNGPGAGNSIVDPRLKHIPTVAETNFTTWKDAQVMWDWFSLLPDSPALRTGPNGRDKGGVTPYGVSISGEPSGTTNLTSATLTVAPLRTNANFGVTLPGFPNGSGFTHYKYKLDAGAFGAETPLATPISLAGLANGTHTVTVIGKNDAGYYQDDAAFGAEAVQTVSKTWTVDTSYVPPPATANVVLSEVLAKNTETLGFTGVFPDIFELRNSGNATADLAGWGLTDNAALPFKYTFPAGTTLAPGAYLVVYGSSSASVPQPRTGFGVKDTGDSLTLTKLGGVTADSVSWGAQLPDVSIGRRPSDGLWDMCVPTFGAANVVAAQEKPARLLINEWLADAQLLVSTDFVELYNPSTLPVNIGACYLTNNPVEDITLSPLRQLTFVAAGGYVSFKADASPSQGPDHLAFKLTPLQGEIGFFDSAQNVIDRIIYGPQSTDVSQGRTPNGALTIAFFNQPTPGGPNPGSTGGGGTSVVNLMPATQSWKYFSSATAAPANDGSGRVWSDPAFTDTSWVSRAQLLYLENAALTNTDGFVKEAANPNANIFAADGTTLLGFNATHPWQTYYFRTHFTFNGPLAGVTLAAKIMLDDGAIIYVNGVEATRVRMDASADAFLLHSPTNVSDAVVETISIPTTSLVIGDNVIAVSVHQNNAVDQSATAGSSDITWGMKLDATVPVAGSSTAAIVINEVLANNATLTDPDGSLSGWIELYNTSASAVNISDMSLTTNTADAREWVFPTGTSVPASGYLVVFCNPLVIATTVNGANMNTGFGLSPVGDHVFLFQKIADGGGLQDAVNFGQQVPDRSIGRVANGTGAFTLNTVTRGASNTAAALGAISTVKVNEWLALPPAGASWLELHNSGASPVLLSGYFLTDNLTNKTKFPVGPLTFIGGTGNLGNSRWLQLIADNDNGVTPNHVNFTLNPAGEALALFSASGVQLESISFGAQSAGISGGRLADGTATIATLNPTPGAANQPVTQDTDGDGIPDWWESLHGFNPGSAADAALDTDGDGQSNLAEYLAGTDPRNANDTLRASITTNTPGQFHIQFIAQQGHAYTIQYKNLLTDALWTTLTQIAAPPSAPQAVDFTDTTVGANTKRFYHVVTPQQP